MKRKQIYLTDELDQKFSELAALRGVSQSEVIREGLEMYLQTLEDKDKEWSELINEMKNSLFHNLKWKREDQYQERLRRSSNNE